MIGGRSKLTGPIACEFGPISLAVLAGDEQRAADILTASPRAIYETNNIRLGPLHLAVDKPACLRLLLRESTRAQVNERWNHSNLLYLAMMICSKKCHKQKADAYPEDSCRLIECVLILLGDERSCLAPDYSYSLRNYCKHAKKEYAEQLKSRRERLKEKAVQHLAQHQLLDLGLNSSTVLDVDAELVASMLRDKGVISFPEPYGVTGHASYRSSVYHRVCDAETAAIFHSMGFRDVSAPDSNGITPLMLCCLPSQPRYVRWLQDHGADVFSRVQWPASYTVPDSFPYTDSPKPPVRDTTSAHHLAYWLGQEMRCSQMKLQPQVSDLALITPFSLAAVTVDRCHCGCSTLGCSPLAVLFKEMTSNISEPPLLLMRIQKFLELSCEDIDIDTNLISAAIRVMTFQTLGLTHVCCKMRDSCSGEHPCYVLVAGFEDEEAEEVRGLESEELDLLEDLVETFQGKLAELSANEPLTVESVTNFFAHCWLGGINQELEKKRQGRTWEEERQETARMGVDWVEEMAPQPEPDEKSLDYWVAQIDRIMAGEPTLS